MKLISLGTGGFHPSEQRHTACFMLPTEGILLDAGTSVFRVRERVATTYLDVLVSHAHLDHIVGLTYLIELRESCPEMRTFMSKQTAHAVRTHLFSESMFPVEPPFEIIELPDSASYVLRNGCRMTCFPLAHPGGSLGYRLDWQEKSMAYVTDTTASANANYVEHIRNVDLLIHECNFPDGQEELAAITGHSCATPVARVARAANAKHLLIAHVNPTPTTDGAIDANVLRDIFPSTQLARDLQEIDF